MKAHLPKWINPVIQKEAAFCTRVSGDVQGQMPRDTSFNPCCELPNAVYIMDVWVCREEGSGLRLAGIWGSCGTQRAEESHYVILSRALPLEKAW